MSAVGVAQIGVDAAELTLEFVDGVEGIPALQPRDRRVQSAAGDEQQRESGPCLLVADAHRTLLEERHAGFSRPGLLSQHPRGCGHRRRGGARFQYLASDRIHDGVLPADCGRWCKWGEDWRTACTLST